MEEEKSPPRLGLGIFISLVAYIFFISASSLVFSMKRLFPIVQILFFQNAVSLFCILPLTLRKGVSHLKTNLLHFHLIRDFSGIGSYFCYFYSLRYLNLTDATTLTYTAPFFVPLIWWAWRHEKINKHVWWSIVIGFIGVFVILNPSKEIFQKGFIFGLLAGILAALAFSSLRVLNSKEEPLSRTLFYYFFFGSLISAPLTYIYWVDPTQPELLKALGVGVATAIAQVLLTKAYFFGTASFLSPLGYSTVIYAGLISWLIFHTTPTLQTGVGAALIIIGGVLSFILRQDSKKIKEALQPPDKDKQPPL